MVWLGGPRGKGGRTRGIVLHDPPPGYHPPRPRIPLKERQREAREDWVLMRVATVVVVLAAAAVAVIFVLMIAGITSPVFGESDLEALSFEGAAP
jgi:hypothetical protein